MRGDKGGDDVVTDGAKRTPRRFGRDGTRCNVEPGAGVLYELGIGRVVARQEITILTMEWEMMVPLKEQV